MIKSGVAKEQDRSIDEGETFVTHARAGHFNPFNMACGAVIAVILVSISFL
jgi:hypothetical protein